METPVETPLLPCQVKIKDLEEKCVVLEDIIKTLLDVNKQQKEENAQLRGQNQYIPLLQFQLHQQQLENSQFRVAIRTANAMLEEGTRIGKKTMKDIENATQLLKRDRENRERERKLKKIKRTFEAAFGRDVKVEIGSGAEEEEDEEDDGEEDEEDDAEE
ncbi:unnamed protein product [Caenorhabditis brenneri]